MAIAKKMYMFSIEYAYMEVKIHSFNQRFIIIDEEMGLDSEDMVSYSYSKLTNDVYGLSVCENEKDCFPNYAFISNNKNSLTVYLNKLINDQDYR